MMMWLSLRLLFADGRRAVVVVLLTLVAVALGSTLFLLVFSVRPAMQARADRTAWLNGENEFEFPANSGTRPSTQMFSAPQFCTCGLITAVWLTPSGPDAPVMPGLPHNPRPGESFVSPALMSAEQQQPELVHRFGPPTGIVSARALSGPDALLVVRYLSPSMMDRRSALAVTRFATAGKITRYEPVILQLLVLVVAIALMAPVVLFVATVTRFTAASRERRLAALRLVGASRSQIYRIAGVESGLAGCLGVCFGIGLFYLIRPVAANISTSGDRWYSSDLTPDLPALISVLIFVPLIASLSALLALGRVQASPLGTARRSGPYQLRLWRLVPLIALVLLIAGVVGSGRAGSLGRSRVLVATVVGVLLALVFAGPWATRALGRVVARCGGGMLLLVGRRLVDDPRAAFRAVSGVMLAIFVSTVFTATTPAAVAALPDDRPRGLNSGAASADLPWTTPAEARMLVARLRDQDGVQTAALAYVGTAGNGSRRVNASVWIGDCDAIAEVVALDRQLCGHADVLATAPARSLLEADGRLRISDLAPVRRPDPSDTTASSSVTVLVRPSQIAVMPASSAADAPAFIVSPEAVDADDLAGIRTNLLLVGYRSDAALERARTVLDHDAPGAQLISGRSTSGVADNSDVRRFRTGLVIATLVAFGVAGTGLALSLIIGLLERRRQYALLRCTGVSIGLLRRIMLLEAAVPLFVGCVLAVGMGVLVAVALLDASGVRSGVAWALAWPPLVGMGVALTVVAAILPLVRRVTDTEETRFE